MFKKITVIILCLLIKLNARWLSFDGTSTPKPPTIEIISGDRNNFVLKLTIPGVMVNDTTIDGETYQLLSLQECCVSRDPGKPTIPFISKMIAIAPQKKVLISAESLEYMVLNDFNIFPAQPVQNDSIYQIFPFTKDEVFYRQNIIYPNYITGNTSPAVFRDLRVTNLQLFPIRFNPFLHQLKILQKSIIRVNFTGIDSINVLPNWPVFVSPTFNSIYQSTILNYNTLSIPLSPTFVRSKYLIICDNSFVNALSSFIFWKKKKGVDVFLQTVNQPSPNDIKTIINNYYNQYGIEYVLLIGDAAEINDPNGHIQTPHIPIYYGWPCQGGDYIRSDYWYATITPDDIADIALGRFSVWTPEQLTTVINKLFSYERYPNNVNWYIQRNDLVSHRADVSGYHACKRDSIMPILQSAKFNYFDDFGGSKTNSDVINHINNTGNQKGISLLNYRGHGLITSWESWDYNDEYFTNSEIYSLTNYTDAHNAWLPIVFEVCCCCGRAGFNLTTDTTGHSECWFRHKNGGGVAALGATRPSGTDCNHKFDTELYRVSFGTPTSPIFTQKLGWAVNDAKVNMATAYGWGDIALDNVRMYHLMGDPELTIYNNWKGYISASHPTQISTGSQNFLVRAFEGGNRPLKDALVCLYKENDVYDTKLTDINGEALFTIAPQRSGTLYITITKNNYGPYEGSCIVTYPPGGGQSKYNTYCNNLNHVSYSPQNRTVTISYQLQEISSVKINIFDITGRMVFNINRNNQKAGDNKIFWNCYNEHKQSINKGIYFIQLITPKYKSVKKLIVL